MARRRDFSDDNVYANWAASIGDAVDKKFYPQGVRIYMRRKRTINSAASIVDKLRKFPIESVQLHLRVYEDGKETFPELIKLYENQLVTARKYPDSFANDLYSFYSNTGRRIRKNGETDLFFGLIAFVEDHAFDDRESSDFVIYSALMDLLMQQTEFLRDDTLDYLHVPAGLSTDGKIYEVDDPYPAIDLPMAKLAMLLEKKDNVDVARFLEEEYSKLGFPEIRTLPDYELLNAQSRTFIGNVNCMAGFVNEYTYDMIPQKPFTVLRNQMRVLGLNELPKSDQPQSDLPGGGIVSFTGALSTQQYLDVLVRHRRRTLTANGVRINFNRSRFYKFLILKEVYKYGDLFLIYKLSTSHGELSGRYNTRTESFITPFNSSIPRPNEFIASLDGLVKWAYAAATCDDALAQPTTESYRTFINDPAATIEFISYGGRLRRTDGTESENPARERDLGRYESREVSLNGFIRRLPPGQKASENARMLAEKVGLELNEGETYVQPFMRHSWVLRKLGEEE